MYFKYVSCFPEESKARSTYIILCLKSWRKVTALYVPYMLCVSLDSKGKENNNILRVFKPGKYFLTCEFQTLNLFLPSLVPLNAKTIMK